MMDDEFDALLRDAAETYRLPPEPPREAMWDAIARARAHTVVAPISARRRATRWLAAASGIAAVLLVGIAIGRASRDTTAPKVVATTDRSVLPPVTREDSTEHAPTPQDAAAANDPIVDATPSVTRRVASQRIGALTATRPTSRDRGFLAELPSDASSYRLAVVEHLTRTEVLLTGFRAHSSTGDAVRVDAQFAALSRELLGTTRLLLATRRGDDPVITRLLQDLEFVLMQLSQYATDGRRIDLDAINQSLDKRNVIPKLRSNIPAGLSASAGT